MSPRAITLRLKQANQRRLSCLALAQIIAGQTIQEEYKAYVNK
mgnify:FL=1